MSLYLKMASLNVRLCLDEIIIKILKVNFSRVFRYILSVHGIVFQEKIISVDDIFSVLSDHKCDYQKLIE